MSVADTIVVLNRGRIEDMGPPDRVYLRPASLFSATFMGESNILEGKVTERSEGRVRVATALGPIAVEGEAELGARVHLSVRPEQLKLGPPGAGEAVALGPARLGESVFQGAHRRCRARAGKGDQVEIHALAADMVLLKR
jgi:spermidine/putrescine transport system ATP-binding protein